MQPATEHGFFFPPPCLPQCEDPEFALVVHPAYLHVVYAPCLSQTPHAAAREVQPSVLHTYLLPPPCFQHRPLAATAEVHLLNEQNPSAPCLPHSPRDNAMLLQPSAEHATVLLSCFLHFPLIVAALVMHASVVQYPKYLLPPPCFQHRPLAATAEVHLLNEQNPSAPCLLQTPRALALVLQPSTEHATVLLSCFVHFPLVPMALLMHVSKVQYP